jgi:hypothetical protein
MGANKKEFPTDKKSLQKLAEQAQNDRLINKSTKKQK